MKNLKPLFILPALAIVIASCGDNQHAKNFNEKTQVDAEGVIFVKLANESGLTEIKAANLAQSISKNSRVISFAKMMVADHSNVDKELTALADEKMVTKSDTITVEHKKTLDSLKALNGANFDKGYMAMMVKDHEAAVKLFEKASNDRITAVHDFARKTLPALKMHLDSANAIYNSLK